MIKGLMAGAALALTTLPGAALAQDGAKLDCATASVDADLKSSLGAAMAGGGDETTRDALFEQLGAAVDRCVADQGIANTQRSDYYDYSLARIAREWLIGDIATTGLSAAVVDKALDFGPGRANPDLTGDMDDAQIMAIVQAYIDSGVDIEKVDSSVWEKVGAYAAATSIYWNKRQRLPF